MSDVESLVWQTKHLHIQKHRYGKTYGIFLLSPVFFCMELLTEVFLRLWLDGLTALTLMTAFVVGSTYLILEPGDWRCYQFVGYWLCMLSRIGACLPDGKGCAETHP